MRVAESIKQLRDALQDARERGDIIGLVPTMGALHAGHLSLIERARQECGQVVVSVFVNPIQFAPGEDFDKYPRTWEADLEACRGKGVDMVFHPSPEEMYPSPPLTRVVVDSLTAGLCGASRPSHFDGVATVVAKLFNISGANRAYFGEKDYQQLQVIRRMVADLNMPVSIVPCPIVREADGLAMSSRNTYLSPEQRTRATGIHAALLAARVAVDGGEADPELLVSQVRRRLTEAGADRVDYVSIVDAETLEPLNRVDRAARLCVAAFFGATRLIDNIGLRAA